MQRRTETRVPVESTVPLNPGTGQASRPGKHRKAMAAPKAPKQNVARWKGILITVALVLLVLGILVVAGYFIKELIDSKYFFCVKSFKFIPLNLACNGHADCIGGEDEQTCVSNLTVQTPFPVRLVSTQNVLQVYQNASGWRTVCADQWSQDYTRITCQQLGYTANPSSVNVTIQSLPQSLTTSFSQVASSKPQSVLLNFNVINSPRCSSGLVVSLTCSDCGERPPQDRIVGGVDARIEDWPWQVSLQLNGQHTCGGSLVSLRWVVSAAHCFASTTKELSRWRVVYGKTYVTILGGSTVDKIIMNGNYDPHENDFDIAMMRLSQPITVTAVTHPVCLPPRDLSLENGAPLVVTGWGYLHENGPVLTLVIKKFPLKFPVQTFEFLHANAVSTTLQKADVTLIGQRTCSSTAVYGAAITPRMLCAGFMDGKVDACQGDSGGPLVYLSDRWQQVGVVSWGVGCARNQKPGVYSNVDSMLDWIYTVMEVEKFLSRPAAAQQNQTWEAMKAIARDSIRATRWFLAHADQTCFHTLTKQLFV
ncbi:transmembrane protease serine 4-like [Scleropages formosus]|uniref:Transmembrane protease serine 4-like n=1 Tax=Scleropages formosus TaxID=113540 RepID=A0A0P7WTD0_SCLFO|nr:transmembrane protease serine 4-like [Scleropages formosus]